MSRQPSIFAGLDDATARTRRTQADRVITKFGGARKLAKLLDFDPSAIYRWNYPEPKGSGGVIPSHTLKKIQKIARPNGILLTSEDLSPETL